MTTFIYSYIDQNGRRRLGCERARDVVHLCALLQVQGIVPIDSWPLGFARWTPKIKESDLALFFSQLGMALEGGVHLLEALHYMAEEETKKPLRAMIEDIRGRILAGNSFSEALGEVRGHEDMLVSWIAIGERQGRLATVLLEIAAHIEKQQVLKKRLMQELMYPLMVLVAVVLVAVLLMVVVMPLLARQFMNLGSDMPALMRFFLVVHDFLAGYGAWIALGLVAFVALLAWLLNEKPSMVLANVKKRVVRWGPLRSVAMLRVYVPFARLFGQLLRSGVSAGLALETLEKHFVRSLYAGDIAALHAMVAQGNKLSQALGVATFVPGMAKQMLSNSERVGRLPEALLKSADYYESELFGKLSFAIRLLEPLTVIILGGVILLLAMGLFLPVLDSYQIFLHR